MIYLHLVKHTWDVTARGNYTYIYTVNTARFCSNENDFFSQDLPVVKLTVHVSCIFSIYSVHVHNTGESGTNIGTVIAPEKKQEFLHHCF